MKRLCLQDGHYVDYCRFLSIVTAVDVSTTAAEELQEAVRSAVEKERMRFSRLLSDIAADKVQSIAALHEQNL
eukprot:SAG31_NODE_40817_length_279_cov_0.572222_1_plen_72_part_10